MTKIQKNRVRKVLKAMRSEKYQQGIHALRTKESLFCPLGIFCDLSKLGHWQDEKFFGWCYVIKGQGLNDSILPSVVQHFYGFRTVSADYTPWKEVEKYLLQFNGPSGEKEKLVADSITQLNDQVGLSLIQIADVIEYCLSHKEAEMFE